MFAQLSLQSKSIVKKKKRIQTINEVISVNKEVLGPPTTRCYVDINSHLSYYKKTLLLIKLNCIQNVKRWVHRKFSKYHVYWLTSYIEEKQ